MIRRMPAGGWAALLTTLLCVAAVQAQEQPAQQPAADQGQDASAESGVPAEQPSAPAQSAEAAPVPAEPAEPPVQTIAVETKEKPQPPTQGQPETTPADATQLDTIQVTASRRLKSQRDLPGSVGALRGEELEKMRAQGMADYIKRVPGVTLIEGTDNDSSIPIIRGVAIGFGNVQLPVGIYADDMPFSDLQQTSSIPDLAPFDLERVEILKGPQGTLFGSGAFAGALRYILNKPVHSVWEGKLQLTALQNSESDSLGTTAAGALNIPLFGDAVAIRIAGNQRNTPGFYDNTGRKPEKDVNSSQQTGGRILASWNPSDKLKLSAFYLGQRSKSDDSGFSTNPDSVERDDTVFKNTDKSAFGGANFLATYDFDWGRLLSSTNRITKAGSGVGHGERGFSVIDPGPATKDPNCTSSCDIGFEDTDLTQVAGIYNNKLLAYTHELRLSSPEIADSDWEWLVGAAYLDYKQVLYGETYIGPVDTNSGGPPATDQSAVPFAPIPTPFGRIYGPRETYFLVRNFDNKATERSLFGETTRRLGEHWEITAGGRAFRTHYAGDHLIAGLQSTAFIGKTEHIEHAEIEEQGLNPKFSIRYKHNRNAQVYLLAAKGYQFGGIQVNPPIVTFDAIANQQSGGQGAAGFGFVPYKSSKLWNYEIGLRTEWLDRRLRFDTVFFYLDWTDLQLQQPVLLDPTPDQPPNDPFPGNALFTVIGNIGKAHSAGAEVALQASPFPGVNFISSVAWISALTDVPYRDGNNQLVEPGTRLPFAPRFQMSNVVSIGRTLPYLDRWEGGFSLTHTHQGEASTSLSFGERTGGFDTLDASVSLQRVNTTWLPQIGFNLTNLTNVRGVSFGSGGTRARTFILVRPRTGLLTLSWNL